MTIERKKFSSQVKPDVLQTFKAYAESEGCQFQLVLEEAMLQYLENRTGESARESVLTHFRESVAKNYPFAERLAEKSEPYFTKPRLFPFVNTAIGVVAKKRREAVIAQLKEFATLLSSYNLSDPVNLSKEDRER